MMFRSMTTSAAASTNRTLLINIAMKGYLMEKALKQGLSKAEARAFVEQRLAESQLSTSRSFREVVGNAVDARDFGEDGRMDDMGEASVANIADGVGQMDDGVTSAPDIVVAAANAGTEEATTAVPMEDINTRLFASRASIMEALPPAQLAPQMDITDSDLTTRMSSFASMTTKDLRKFVRETSGQAETHAIMTPSEEAAHSALLKKQSMHKASREVQDMVNYVIFLVLFLVVTMHGRHDDTPFKASFNFMSQLQTKPFPSRIAHVPKILKDVVNVNEVYDYFEGVLYDALYAGMSFDGDASPPPGRTYNPKGVLGTYGQIWGPIRIGQLRVDGRPCEGALASLLHLETTMCYPAFSKSTMSTHAFGHGHDHAFTSETPPDASVWYMSQSERWYPGPNFNVYLSPTEPASCDPATRTGHCEAYETIEELRTLKYIDMATRAIFVDMTLYNANFNQVSTVRLLFEQTGAGGVGAQSEFITYRLYNYITASDYIRLACQLLILMIVTYELSKEMRLAHSTGLVYWKSTTNWIFCLNFVLFYNMFIVIITDAYIETQDELELMAQVELNTMSKEIVQHVLYNLVFRIPFVGPRYLKPMYEAAVKRTKEMVETMQHRTLGSVSFPTSRNVLPADSTPVEPMASVATPTKEFVAPTMSEETEPSTAGVPAVSHTAEAIAVPKPTVVPMADAPATLPPIRAIGAYPKIPSVTALCSVRESSCEVEHAYTSSVHWARQQLDLLKDASVADIQRFKMHIERYKERCSSAMAS
ncbi:hypothetical protein ACHHYP_13118 [Achlya hypogyna]|uniref:Polycystin domain-containing protein n=1 Tax=Achlya hypogyna TaxID=1202772 RepID=A0A1V9YFV8_ACHHY|nr:hypothetical protein ACHHYP_13118 [Achlya hypogyna]